MTKPLFFPYFRLSTPPKLALDLYNKQRNFDSEQNLKERQVDSQIKNQAKQNILKEKELVTKMAIEKEKLKIAKINKNKYDK